jgi:hypothetical protein
MRTESTKEVITAQVNGETVPVEELPSVLAGFAEGERPAVTLRYALYRNSGLRHVVRLDEQAMGEVAESLRGTPINYQHRAHVGKQWGMLSPEPEPLQGAVISAEVEEVKGEPTIVGDLKIDGQRALDEMARGMLPRNSIEFFGDPTTATCSECDAAWFSDREDRWGLHSCQECDSEIGSVVEGRRVYVDYHHAEGVGTALLYEPASTGTGPIGMSAMLDEVIREWGQTPMWGRKKKSKAEEAATDEPTENADEPETDPVEEQEAVEVEAQVPAADLEVVAAELAKAKAELDRYRQAEAKETAKAEAEAEQLNRAKIAEYMRAGYGIKDGDNTAEVRARDPEYFDSVVSCFRPNPNAGAGQRAEGASPPQDHLEPKEVAAKIEARAAELMKSDGLTRLAAVQAASREMRTK